MKIVLGDIHGCLYELDSLLRLISFKPGRDVLYSVGDLVDRGPESMGVVRRLKELKAVVVCGNHDEKFRRWMNGNKVQIDHGLEKTVNEFVKLSEKEKQEVREYFLDMSSCFFDEQMLIVHAQPCEVSPGSRHKSNNYHLYGSRRRYKEADVRYNWWDFHNPQSFGGRTVFYGHYWFDFVKQVNNTVGLDTSCIRGGYLSGFVLETKEVVQVKGQNYYPQQKTSTLEQEAWDSLALK